MQSAVLSETRTPELNDGAALSDSEFKALLALASRSGMDRSEFGKTLGSGSGCNKDALENLHRLYLDDVVSSLSGGSVRESIRITEHGRNVLVAALENMCELPE